MTLSVSAPLSDSGPSGKAWLAFEKYVESESDGRVKVEIYWNSSLAPYVESLQATGSGLADLAQPATVYYPDELPASNWAIPALAITERDFMMNSALVGTRATRDMLKDPIFRNEFKAANVEVLAAYSTMPAMFECTDAIADGDLTGLRIRSGGKLQSEVYTALGATPVSIVATEAYEAVQRGMLDCLSAGLASASDQGYLDVTDHIITNAYFPPAVNLVTMNLDRFNALPEDLQELLRRAGEGLGEDSIVAELKLAEGLVQRDGKAAHMVPVTIPNLQERMNEYWSEKVDQAQNNPPAGVSAEDAERIHADYAGDVARYTEALDKAGFNTQGDGADLKKTVTEAASSIDAIRAYFASNVD